MIIWDRSDTISVVFKLPTWSLNPSSVEERPRLPFKTGTLAVAKGFCLVTTSISITLTALTVFAVTSSIR